MNTATANERKSTKGHKGAGGRPKGSKDTRPRMNIALRNAMARFLDSDGNLVTEALREALQDPDGRVKVAAVKVALDYHIKTGGSKPPSRGLVIVLSSQDDPLAARSRPTKPIDLTMSGPVIDAEPGVTAPGARATSPVPALPPGPATQLAAALNEQAKKGPGTGKPAPKTTPERFAEVVANGGRLDATYWQGDCPRCHGPKALTWRADAEGRAADFACSRGCAPADIITAARARSRAARSEPAAPARLPRALQSDGVDMVCVSDNEPKFLPLVPGED